MAVKFGTPRADTLIGTFGTDYISGGAGNDFIRGYDIPPGQIDVRASFSDSADFLFGGNGNDSIKAGGGDDFLCGGAGRDTLDGGLGVDYLKGAAGRDVFFFDLLYASPGAPSPDTGVGEGKRDVILDFRQGTDKIDLRGWENDYGGALGANFVGKDELTVDEQLQVGFHYEGGNTIIDLGRIYFTPMPGEEIEYRGPAGQIEIVGHVNLTENDFIFSS
ncbi:M10 family metallopeptidase C-terminal domain-containing protein [Belnapia moabensis]|uniref:M10 family metallopeptidase C-terminal domain-containing protein n=1 Tax=Belnapia moabensis TaxID=365533 RepID=UPI0012ED547E|nr:M10 family metallopeptidase C-terminal domain-containing protein [Belnapia moabensis]